MGNCAIVPLFYLQLASKDPDISADIASQHGSVPESEGGSESLHGTDGYDTVDEQEDLIPIQASTPRKQLCPRNLFGSNSSLDELKELNALRKFYVLSSLLSHFRKRCSIHNPPFVNQLISKKMHGHQYVYLMA